MKAAELGRRARQKAAMDIDTAVSMVSGFDDDPKVKRKRKLTGTATGALVGGTGGYVLAPWLALLAKKYGLGEWVEPFLDSPSYASNYGAAIGALTGAGVGAAVS